VSGPAGRGRAARIWRVAAAVVVALLVAAALAIGALRLAIDRVPENAARIQAWVEKQTGLRVEYDGLDARLRWFGPEVVLHGIRILQRDGSQSLFSAREGSVGLDLLSLFQTGELVAGRVHFAGPTVTVVRLPDGRIRLLGQNERPLDRPPFDLDRLPAGRVDIQDATVTYRDLTSGATPVTLRGLKLRLQRKHDSTGVSGSATLPDWLGHRLSFGGDLHGSLEHPDGLDARIELTVDKVVLAGLAPYLPSHLARPVDGAGGLDAVVSFTHGKVIGARVDLALAGVGLVLPERTPPPVETLSLSSPQLPPEASAMSLPQVTPIRGERPGAAGPREVRYAELRGSVRLRRDGEAWVLRAQNLALRRATRPGAVPSSFYLRWRGNATTTFETTVSASRVPLDDAWPLVLAVAPPAFDKWAGLDPVGEVRSLRAEVSRDRAGAPPRFYLTADVSDVGIAASGRSPGLSGVSGVVSGTDQSGMFAVRSRDFSFDLPWLFIEPIAGAVVTADGGWTRDGDAWVVNSRRILVEHPKFKAHGTFEYRFVRPGVSPSLAMDIQVDAADVAYAGHVLPYGAFGTGAVSWLAPAFLGGHVDAGHVTYRGPTHLFPFRHGEGDFKATAQVSGVSLDYYAGFAPLKSGHGTVEFHNSGFVARLDSGDVGGLALARAEVGIADMSQAVVDVDVDATGDLATALPFVQSSPVGQTLGREFMGLTGQGPASYEVKLALPTHEGAEHDVLVRSTLRSVNVRLPALRAPFERVTGDFEVHNLAITAPSLRGTMLGGPFELQVRPGAPSAESDASVVMHGTGRLQGPALPAFLALPSGIRATGAADWTFDGRIARSRDGGAWGSRYDVGSSLVGLGLTAPQPFAKAPADARPTRVSLAFPASGATDLTVESGAARVRLTFIDGEDGHWRLDRGIARYDTRPLVLPDRPGLRIAGEWPEFDLGEWLALGEGGGSVSSLSDWLGPTEIRIEKARLFGFEFPQLSADVRPQPTALELRLSGPAAAGSITIPGKLEGTVPIVIDMDRLVLTPVEPAAPTAKSEGDPRKLPALDADVRDFVWRDRHFGHVTVKSLRDPRGLLLKDFEAQSKVLTIAAHGGWLAEGAGSRTTLSVEARSNDLGAASDELGIPGGFEARKARAVADLNWPGGPSGDILTHLNGKLSVSLEQGQVRSVKPGGVGRLLGLASLAELPRRLALDFHDVTDAGLAFDTVHGDFEIRDGNAYTQNLVLKSAAVDIGVVGRTGLAAEDYDQTVVVSGNPVGPVTVAGALVGGPIGAAGGLLLSQIFKGKLQGVAKIYYRVTGPWSAPVVERVSSAVGEAASTQSTEEGKGP
jgi:uncharacterized protein (TIGR02099 family)